MEKILQQIIDMVKEMVGNNYLYFGDGIMVQCNENAYPFYAWAVCVSPKDHVYVMDAEEQWHKLEVTDINADKMIGTLVHHIEFLHKQYKPKEVTNGTQK